MWMKMFNVPDNCFTHQNQNEIFVRRFEIFSTESRWDDLWYVRGIREDVKLLVSHDMIEISAK